MKKNLFLIVTLIILLSFLIAFTLISCKDYFSGEDEAETTAGQTLEDETETTTRQTSEEETETDETSSDDTSMETTTNESDTTDGTADGSADSTTTTNDTTTDSTEKPTTNLELEAVEELALALAGGSGNIQSVETVVEDGKFLWNVTVSSPGGPTTYIVIDDATMEVVSVERVEN